MAEVYGGSTTLYRVGAKPNVFTLPPQLLGASEPQHDMTVSEFAEAASPEVTAQMWNRSKKCPMCHKVNAVSMASCNGCGFGLSDTPETATECVPMGFVYGVARTKTFPLKLSLRLEERTTLVYDDPLARATCHMNAIPTDVHLPDWRWLLTRPAKAAALLRRLEDAAWRAVETNFFSSTGWRTSVLREGVCSTSAELRPHCVAALNAVVSQYQLHMHYIVPPFRPDSYHMLITGRRFEQGRWLPMSYVYGALDALGDEGIPEAPSMETAEIFKLIEAKGGPNYDAAYAAEIARNAASHEALSNWRADAFSAVAHAVEREGGAESHGKPAFSYTMVEAAGVASGEVGADAVAALKEDSKLLSSYGWGAPADPEGEESTAPCTRAPASYYSFAKAPSDVLTAVAWSVE